MQEKSEKFQSFFDRTNVLARKLGINPSDLPVEIGVGASMFHSYRSGKYPISDKAWRKLEAAERAAGLLSEAAEPVRSAESETKVKDSDPPPYHFPDSGKLIAPDETTALLRRIAEALEEIAGHLRKG